MFNVFPGWITSVLHNLWPVQYMRSLGATLKRTKPKSESFRPKTSTPGLEQAAGDADCIFPTGLRLPAPRRARTLSTSGHLILCGPASLQQVYRKYYIHQPQIGYHNHVSVWNILVRNSPNLLIELCLYFYQSYQNIIKWIVFIGRNSDE